MSASMLKAQAMLIDHRYGTTTAAGGHTERLQRDHPMRTINEISDQSIQKEGSERQVLLYPSNSKDFLPGKMEEIKISIVNNRATVSKRERDEVTAVTPCSKRLRSAVFICSTPRTASAHSSRVVSPTRDLEQNREVCDEWDDSLLEPSDNEGDSPLYLTIDEIESLLEDDSHCATEPSGWESDNDTCKVNILTLKSKDDVKKVSASACGQLDLSDTMIEESDADEDQNNYATMAPSPLHSVILPVEFGELSKSNSLSVCIAQASPDSVQDKTILDGECALNVPLSDVTKALLCQHNNACSPNPYPQPLIAYSEIDNVEFSEDGQLSFDYDINNLLATSPGDVTSSEEEWAPELSIPCKKQNTSIIDSKMCLKNSNSVQVPTVCVSSQGEDHHLSLSSHNKPDSNKVDPFPTVTFTEHKSLKKDQSPITSSVVIPEVQLSTGESGGEQNMRPNSSAEVEETKEKQEVGVSSSPTDQPVNLSAIQTTINPTQISASVGCRKPGSSVPSKEKEKSLAAVNAYPRQAPRRVECNFEVREKDRYLNEVLIHLEAPEGKSHYEDPRYELSALLQQISKENQNWQHPSNLTRRNYPRSGKKPSKCCGLNQWVAKNGGAKQRFHDFPATFQRSPIPDVLPSL